MLAPVPRLGHHDAMRVGRAPRWGAMAVAIAGATAAAMVAGVSSWNQPEADVSFSGTLAWTVAAPVAIAATFGIAWWSAFRGDRALSRWSLACAVMTTGYALASAAMVWMPAHGFSRSPLLAVAVIIVAAAWPGVLALLQSAALATGESALGRQFGRRSRVALLGAAGVVLALGILFPPPVASPVLADVPTLLPTDLARSPGCGCCRRSRCLWGSGSLPRGPGSRGDACTSGSGSPHFYP